MSTNYYAVMNPCKHCGKGDEIHLGKSASGWKFAFRYHNGEYYKDANTLKEFLKKCIIKNEYNVVTEYDDFMEFVEKKQAGKTRSSDEDDREVLIIDGYVFCNYEFS